MLNLNRDEDRRKAVKASLEALKNYDPLEVLNDLNENAIYICKLGIKRLNPNISEEELKKELGKILDMSK